MEERGGSYCGGRPPTACFVLLLFCLLVVLVLLSVTMQVIDWPKLVSEMTCNVLMGSLDSTVSSLEILY